jgi:hypothetical protein
MTDLKNRSFSGGRFSLDVGGYNVGFLKSFSGLNMGAEVFENDTGPDNVVKKHITIVKPTPGKAKIGIGMGKGMYEWIKQSFDKSAAYRDGAFTSANFNYEAQSTVTFKNALITSVTVPKMAGESKDGAYFDVEFDAETVEWAKAGGESIQAKFGVKQKAWTCTNFKLEIDGLKCERVASIESFTWKCNVVRDQIGATRLSTIHPTKVITPEIKFSVSYGDHQAWAEKAKAWFVDGKCEEADEYKGRIVFLNHNGDELGWINLMNLGFSKFEDGESVANAEGIKRFNVTMYCEKMAFELKYTDA